MHTSAGLPRKQFISSARFANPWTKGCRPRKTGNQVLGGKAGRFRGRRKATERAICVRWWCLAGLWGWRCPYAKIEHPRSLSRHIIGRGSLNLPAGIIWNNHFTVQKEEESRLENSIHLFIPWRQADLPPLSYPCLGSVLYSIRQDPGKVQNETGYIQHWGVPSRQLTYSGA